MCDVPGHAYRLSRDMLISWGICNPSACRLFGVRAWSGFDAAGLAVFVGVDGQFADDFAGVAVDHEDV